MAWYSSSKVNQRPALCVSPLCFSQCHFVLNLTPPQSPHGCQGFRLSHPHSAGGDTETGESRVFLFHQKTRLGLLLPWCPKKETELLCLAWSYLWGWMWGHPIHSMLLFIRRGAQWIQGRLNVLYIYISEIIWIHFSFKNFDMKNLLVEFHVIFFSHYISYILYGWERWTFGKQLTRYFLWLTKWKSVLFSSLRNSKISPYHLRVYVK